MKVNSYTITGAIVGDILGSNYEFARQKVDYNIDLLAGQKRFTDDTVLTIAVADALVHNKPFKDTILLWARKYPHSGYGGRFKEWLRSPDPQPYGSFGNGGAMRVSPVGFAFDNLETVLDKARQSAEVTHNHPEGIKGTQTVAGSVFMAHKGHSKEEIRDFVVNEIGYNLDFTIDAIRPFYKGDVSSQGSVPQAIVCFLESHDYESAIRKAIYLGGDTDTLAAIAGSIAAAFYKEIPEKFMDLMNQILPEEFKQVISQFDQMFIMEK